MSKVIIQYYLIFDPAETWTYKSQFEDDFATFLRVRGLEAEIVQMPDSSIQGNVRYLFIKKSEGIVLNPAPKEKSVKQTVASLSQKKGFDGKFVKANTPSK